MPNCMEEIKILQIIHPNQQQKSMKMIKSLVIQDVKLTEIVIDRQDHTAFGIEIDQHLRFQKG